MRYQYMIKAAVAPSPATMDTRADDMAVLIAVSRATKNTEHGTRAAQEAHVAASGRRERSGSPERSPVG